MSGSGLITLTGVWLLEPIFVLGGSLELLSTVLGCIKATELVLVRPGGSDVEPLDLHSLLSWA